ncbi:DNA-directed RNA polymerase subunit K [Candidatus Micrarchaeota archaeon]|nr:DNA-directed RNA polymerase subunit K [Candidatus Micrarchaeota archaeon]
MVQLTKYEYARIISARALQLEMGAPPLIHVTVDDDVIKIAMKEFDKGIIPLAVVRQ